MRGIISLGALALFVTGLFLADANAADSTTTDNLLTACRALTSEFQTTLKGELSDAIKKGGPAHAIEVCQQIAPAVASDYSTLPGWTVRRTTAQWRNPSNKPDTYEVAALARLEEDTLPEYYSWISDSTGERFRYLAAIRMTAVCIPCHGAPARLVDTVRTVLETLYPDDQAVNFRPGDLRGAISVIVGWPDGRPVADSICLTGTREDNTPDE